MKHGVLAEI